MRALIGLGVLVLTAGLAFAQYPEVTIHDIQYVEDFSEND